MKKVNFTKEHFDKLKELALEMLVENTTVKGNMGQEYSILDLFHNLTLNTLVAIRSSLNSIISKKEEIDEWSITDGEQRVLESLKKKKEIVNLLIGYKRQLEESAKTERERQILTKQLNELKDSTMSPEDKIKEIEKQLEELNSTTTF